EGDVGCGNGSIGKPGVYIDRDEFLANVTSGRYDEDFVDVPLNFVSTPLEFADGSYSYSVFSAMPLMPPSGGLFNGPGFISVNTASDQIVVTLTSGNVTAIGGN